MLCVYSHLIIFHELYGLGSQGKCGIVVFVCLFDLILYVHSTIFQLCGTVLPGLNQY